MNRRRIVLGVFEAGSQQVGGTVAWSHPRRGDGDFRDIRYWVDMARLLDDAGFDFLFFAGGSFGYASMRGELSEVLIENGMVFSLDGAYLIPALAVNTRRLNFVVTSTTGADHPLHAVRKFSTLDHVTGGRIGWNIVTGASQNTMAQMLGHDEIVAHDVRYQAADEYLDVALKFWEGGNEDDVIVMDRERGIFADPEKMHPVTHDGTFYRSHGYHTLPPSPQRSPLLVQAGTSEAGRDFAARSAECVFVQGTTYAQTASSVADIRERARGYGRDPYDIKIVVGATIVVAPTSGGAAELRAEFDALQSDELAAHYYAGNTGVNLLEYDLDRPLADQLRFDDQAGQMGQSNIERFLRPRVDGTLPTVREILDQLKGRGTRGFPITGDPTEVADEIERMLDETDLDGFMLESTHGPESMRDFIELVQPILRDRGRLEPEREGATFREQLIGKGPHLLPEHRGATHRPVA